MSVAPPAPSDGDGIAGQPDVPADLWLRGPDAVAGFTPAEGMCLTAFRVRTEAGWWRVLAEPPDRARLQARPAFYGNPLLFPFPMAVGGGRFAYRGREVVLPPGREGRVVHGFARDVPWTVERRWADDAGDHVQAALTTAGDPDLLGRFPFPFRLRVVYSLAGTALTLVVAATNLGAGPLPAGFGVHPYFPLSPDPAGSAADLVVRADVTHTAVVGAGGAALDLRPAAPPVDLQGGRRVAPWLADRLEREGHGAGAAPVYARVDPATGAVYPAGGAAAVLDGRPAPAGDALDDAGLAWSLTDTRLGREVVVRTSGAFRVLVLFAPRREATVLSPVLCTCLPDAFNLAAGGHAGGMVEIAPGATWRARVRLTAGPRPAPTA
jgi:galactose mutarotase-like enzyme